jgi:hypothetical protein
MPSSRHPTHLGVGWIQVVVPPLPTPLVACVRAEPANIGGRRGCMETRSRGEADKLRDGTLVDQSRAQWADRTQFFAIRCRTAAIVPMLAC